jgi:hypothetical protein
MNLLLTVLAAFPLGFLLARRESALLAYLIADSFVFTFQTLNVLLTWMSGDKGLGGSSGFGDYPRGSFPIHYAQGEVMAYGLVNLLITLAGVGLVLLGARVRSRRASAA